MSTKRREPTADPPADAAPAEPENASRLDRRQAVHRMGRYAAYTAPAMLTLLLPESAHADRHIGSPPPPPEGSARAASARTRRER